MRASSYLTGDSSTWFLGRTVHSSGVKARGQDTASWCRCPSLAGLPRSHSFTQRLSFCSLPTPLPPRFGSHARSWKQTQTQRSSGSVGGTKANHKQWEATGGSQLTQCGRMRKGLPASWRLNQVLRDVWELPGRQRGAVGGGEGSGSAESHGPRQDSGGFLFWLE